MNRSFNLPTVSQSTGETPPAANYIMVAIVFLFFGAAILVIAIISEVMIPFDFSFLFWITGFCFIIAIVSLLVAFVVRGRHMGSGEEPKLMVRDDYQGVVLGETSREVMWTPSQFQKWKRKDFGRTNGFISLSNSDFKELVSELFRRMRYSVEHSSYHADFGIDLIARKGKEVISIEVKKWKQGRDVGTEIVRRSVEGRWKCGASKSIIVTTSGFTPKAKVLAKKNPIELWNATKLSSLIGEYLLEDETLS
ncbi:MAG: restriction endonuclease [Thaumarchaeota archaeon]|nr:restriction endonuclease [Nitrososphaerota archaeon]